MIRSATICFDAIALLAIAFVLTHQISHGLSERDFAQVETEEHVAPVRAAPKGYKVQGSAVVDSESPGLDFNF